MKYVKWTLAALVALIVAAFLHYTLPQHDIARITDTYEKRIDFGGNSWFWAAPDSGNQGNGTNRDVFFIQTVRPNGKVMVYRNEDTGWGWPPYFKFDTSNLQAQAADLRSTKEDPHWVVITHYGWRNTFLSIYPNAVSIEPAEGPDVTIIPWVNIVVLTLLAALAFWLWRRWVRFRENRLEPVFEEIGDAIDRADDQATGLWQRLRRWVTGGAR